MPRLKKITLTTLFVAFAISLIITLKVKGKVLTVGTDLIVGYGWWNYVIRKSQLLGIYTYETNFVNAPLGEIIKQPEYLTSVVPRILYLFLTSFLRVDNSLNLFVMIILILSFITLFLLIRRKTGNLLGILAITSILLSGPYMTKLLSHPTFLFGIMALVSVYFFFEAQEFKSTRSLFYSLLFAFIAIWADAYNFILFVLIVIIVAILTLTKKGTILEKTFLVYVAFISISYSVLYLFTVALNQDSVRYNRPFSETVYFGANLFSIFRPTFDLTFDETDTNFIGFGILFIVIYFLVTQLFNIKRHHEKNSYSYFLLLFACFTLYFSLGSSEKLFNFYFFNNIFFELFPQFRVSSRFLILSLASLILFLFLTLDIKQKHRMPLIFLICTGILFDLFKMTKISSDLFDYSDLKVEYSNLSNLGLNGVYAILPDEDINRSILIEQMFLDKPVKNSILPNFKLSLISGVNDEIASCLTSRENIDFLVLRANKNEVNNIDKNLWNVKYVSSLYKDEDLNKKNLTVLQPKNSQNYKNIDSMSFEGVTKEGTILNVGFRMIDTKSNLRLNYKPRNHFPESLEVVMFSLKESETVQIYNNSKLIFNDFISSVGTIVKIDLVQQNSISFRVQELNKPSTLYAGSTDNRMIGPIISLNSLSRCHKNIQD